MGRRDRRGAVDPVMRETAEQVAQPMDEFFAVDRLGEIEIRAILEARDPTARAVPGAQGDDADIAHSAQPGQDVQPCPVREVGIDDSDIAAARRHRAIEFQRRSGRFDVEPLILQMPAQRCARPGISFDEDDAHLCCQIGLRNQPAQSEIKSQTKCTVGGRIWQNN